MADKNRKRFAEVVHEPRYMTLLKICSYGDGSENGGDIGVRGAKLGAADEDRGMCCRSYELGRRRRRD